MANINSTATREGALKAWKQELARDKAVSEAREANTAAFAIKHLGRMLSDAQSDAGYESIDHSQWSAVGIAIEQLAEKLEQGVLAHPEDFWRMAVQEDASPEFDPATIFYHAQSDDPEEIELAIKGLRDRAAELKKQQEAAQ